MRKQIMSGGIEPLIEGNMYVSIRHTHTHKGRAFEMWQLTAGMASGRLGISSTRKVFPTPHVFLCFPVESNRQNEKYQF
ncbi:Uncharacterized protein APZ42_020145 [Daphnia magna]|uniref:Uncharacterized protein n=1 Tax=Daphnia magna TaxID=35525 RepID=A0A164Y046_9CRUS|nr:Uncharacterized protein APZ42_020145 [Daphnia magna]